MLRRYDRIPRTQIPHCFFTPAAADLPVYTAILISYIPHSKGTDDVSHNIIILTYWYFDAHESYIALLEHESISIII